MGRGLALLCLVGCDRAFGIAPVTLDVDASNDLACATSSALMCADFEQPAPGFFSSGMFFAGLAPPSDITVALIHPGQRSTTALSLDSAGGDYGLVTTGIDAVSRITATFALDLARVTATTRDTTLITLGYEGTGLTACNCFLMVEGNSARLLLGHHCDSVDGEFAPVLAILPTGFVDATLVCDLSTATASAQIAGMPHPITLGLNPAATSGTPTVDVGNEQRGTGDGGAIVLDQILVTADP